MASLRACGSLVGRLPAQSREPFAAQQNHAAVDFDFKQIVERLIAANVDGGAGQEAMFLPMAQPVGAVVLNFPDNGRLAGAELVQFAKLAPLQFSFGGWNRMPVRVFEGFAQVGGDGLFEAR